MGVDGTRWHARWIGFLAALVLISLAATPATAAPAPSDAASGPMPAAPTACTMPGLVFTHVPAYGVWGEPLKGRVECLDPGTHRVAVYIWVGGWWTKPTFANPTVPIAADGTWSSAITTGGDDELATRIAAFAIPTTYTPPLLGGSATLPQELYDAAAAHALVTRDASLRRISFSGYTWQVKESDAPVGPGPNRFSGREEDVFVDADGYLHLRIARHGDAWWSSEVICDAPLHHGRYVFTLRGAVDDLDPNAVLGLFTWDTDAPEHTYREIDIELSRWGEADAPNAQYVVQPWDTPGNRHRFDLSLSPTSRTSTHGFGWYPGIVYYQSLAGAAPFPQPAARALHAWEYAGVGVPPANGSGNARINLWLLDGQAPLDGRPVEVVVESFRFIPGTSRDPEPAAFFLPLVMP